LGAQKLYEEEYPFLMSNKTTPIQGISYYKSDLLKLFLWKDVRGVAGKWIRMDWTKSTSYLETIKIHQVPDITIQ